MRERAQVTSIDALRRFKHALTEFMETARRALIESESDVQRTIVWLEREQLGYWKREARRRAEKVTQAKSELYRKEVSSADGRPDSVAERRALDRAQQRHREAEQKLAATQTWARRLQREIVIYKGQSQSLSAAVYGDIPRALERLERMAGNLDDYVRLQAPSMNEELEGAEAIMARIGKDLERRRSPHAGLRRLAADDVTRAENATDRTALRAAPAGQPRPPEHREVLDLRLPDRAPNPGAKVVIERGCLSARRIVLIRGAESSTEDSGWFIATAGTDRRDEPELQAVTVEGVGRRRPDLKLLLTLPESYLILLEGTAVSAVLNGDDIDLLDSAEGDE